VQWWRSVKKIKLSLAATYLNAHAMIQSIYMGAGMLPIIKGENEQTYIAAVRNQLAQKDLLVRVERVDDQAHQLSNLRLEGECFGDFAHDFDVRICKI
jgi:hypothetical protein